MSSRRGPREVTGQLSQQERIAACLAGDLQNASSLTGASSSSAHAEERSCLIVSHRLEWEADAGLRAGALEQRLQERLGRDLFGAKACDRQDRGACGWRISSSSSTALSASAQCRSSM